jgi:hypothetical protein
VVRIDGPKLDRGVVESDLHSPRSHHDPGLVECEVGRVEEHDLADLCVQRIDAQAVHDPTPSIGRHGELQLDGVDLLEQREELDELLGVEAGRRDGHERPPLRKGQLLSRSRTLPRR